ncbi:hypothetical protein ABK040_005306 [Willaertia magna]
MSFSNKFNLFKKIENFPTQWQPTSVVISKNKNCILFANYNCKGLLVYDLQSKELIQNISVSFVGRCLAIESNNDNNEALLVGDKSGYIYKYDLNKLLNSSVEEKEAILWKSEDEFDHPNEIACYTENNQKLIYFSHNADYGITVLDSETGVVIKNIVESRNSMPLQPTSFCFDIETKELIIAEGNLQMVTVFKWNGFDWAFNRDVGKEGDFIYPSNVKVDKDNVIVCDNGKSSIMIYKLTDGTLVNSLENQEGCISLDLSTERGELIVTSEDSGVSILV